MTQRYKITVRADDVELRGYIDGPTRVTDIASALNDGKTVVVASPASGPAAEAASPAAAIAAQHDDKGMNVIDVNHLAYVIGVLERDGGRLVIVHKPEDIPSPWMVGTEFGEEAEDSDMAGGASYGLGAKLQEALTQVAEEMGYQ